MNDNPYKYYEDVLEGLAGSDSLRTLQHAVHDGKWIISDGKRMLNLSSNDYLGLAADRKLHMEFLSSKDIQDLPFSSSSSRLLTGNFGICDRLEDTLAGMYGRESALVLSSGYHMNTGILPAICDRNTLILADKLVHASLIDGIRLCEGRCIRYRHQDYAQLENIIEREHSSCSRIIIVTESIFSMDGDTVPLQRLVEIKHRWPGIMLYVDEAHAVGTRGRKGLGLAEEEGCINDIDLLCGTFGKALASAGAFVLCGKTLKEYLVNRMRTLIFTTALPPVNIAWSLFIMERLEKFSDRRDMLRIHSEKLRNAFRNSGIPMPSSSHIIPVIKGSGTDTVNAAADMQSKGFYVLPIRPPTVPEGTSRLRISLTAALDGNDIDRLIANI